MLDPVLEDSRATLLGYHVYVTQYIWGDWPEVVRMRQDVTQQLAYGTATVQCSGGESCHRNRGSHIQNIKGLTSPASLRETRNEIMNWKSTTEHKRWFLKWWQNVNDSYKNSLEQKCHSIQTNVSTHSCYSVAQITSFELVYRTARCCSPRLL